MKQGLRKFIVSTLRGLSPSTRIFIANRLMRWSVRLAFLANEIAPEITE